MEVIFILIIIYMLPVDFSFLFLFFWGEWCFSLKLGQGMHLFALLFSNLLYISLPYSHYVMCFEEMILLFSEILDNHIRVNKGYFLKNTL